MNKPRNHELRIGLTGGIASGKSTVADLFAELGIPVIDTDIVARQIVEPGQPGLKAVIDAFGTDLLSEDGHLDRRRLRNLIFDNPDQRQILEGIVHPLIRARTIELANQAGGPYQVLVVPLLIETGFRALVDRVLVVDCPEEQQQARLQRRDDETPERVERIIAAQAHRHERLGAADDILDNSASLEQTRTQVRELHTLYLQLAKQGSDP
jgi:dephospho-CoA kinase